MYLVLGLSFVSREYGISEQFRPGGICGAPVQCRAGSALEYVPRDSVQLLWVHPSLELTSLGCTAQDLYSAILVFGFLFPLLSIWSMPCSSLLLCLFWFFPCYMSEDGHPGQIKPPFAASLLGRVLRPTTYIIVVIHWSSSSFDLFVVIQVSHTRHRYALVGTRQNYYSFFPFDLSADRSVFHLYCWRS